MYDMAGERENLHYEHAICRAVEIGVQIVLPTKNQLQIDLDSEDDYVYFEKQLKTLKRLFHVNEVNVQPSRHGLPRRHVTITLDGGIDDMTRLALQAACGSDRVRELLNIVRVLDRPYEPSSLFYEAKEKL